MDEGYIKFRAHYQSGPPYTAAELDELLKWRAHYYQLGLIGAYDTQIGFGNISHRIGDSEAFYISGSATSLLPRVDERHFSKVVKVRASTNELWCESPIIASSESMSHAAIYGACSEVRAILHAHDGAWWRAMLYRVPTTAATAPYGSPEMVDSIIDLMRNTDLARGGVFAMAGHEEGLFFFGRNFEEVEAIVTRTRAQY
ncbi:MAG: class II aldolase/adducin family protein [Bacteroidetes bacterium]|nr:MAG: class II aldolase/adducin family protein [Bacteroidota bacterium]